MQGNVEYKVRLLNPTAERFTRLVTQLKWRLLEGGGQAYYELGVADSGQLVGLTNEHLALSLQTLEEMAGEIGASVIIVKEIELPPALVEATRNRTLKGRIADGAVRMNKIRVADYVEDTAGGVNGVLATASLQEADSQGPSAFIQEVEDDSDESRANSQNSVSPPTNGKVDANPSSKPSIASTPAAEDDYSSSPGVDVDRNGRNHDDDVSDVEDGIFANELEIQSVYKPRPARRRTPTPAHTPQRRGKARRAQADDNFALDISSLHAPSAPVDVPVSSARKAEKWRKKDLRRAQGKSSVPRVVVGDGEESEMSGYVDSQPPSASSLSVDAVGTSEHSKAIDEIEAAASLLNLQSHNEFAPVFIPPSTSSTATPTVSSPPTNESQDTPPAPADAEVWRKGVLVPNDPSERRYIVEALVVRKMSLEDSFLDFGGF